MGLQMFSRKITKIKNSHSVNEEVAISVSNLSKVYNIYDRPEDRLKQSILPRIKKIFGITSKQYHNEFWALRNVSFQVKKGNTIGIIGRNGSGKSNATSN